MSPQEEGTDMSDFNPYCAHLFFMEVYSNFPHHNYGLHLDGVIPDNAVCQFRWHHMTVKFSS